MVKFVLIKILCCGPKKSREGKYVVVLEKVYRFDGRMRLRTHVAEHGNRTSVNFMDH